MTRILNRVAGGIRGKSFPQAYGDAVERFGLLEGMKVAIGDHEHWEVGK